MNRISVMLKSSFVSATLIWLDIKYLSEIAEVWWHIFQAVIRIKLARKKCDAFPTPTQDLNNYARASIPNSLGPFGPILVMPFRVWCLQLNLQSAPCVHEPTTEFYPLQTILLIKHLLLGWFTLNMSFIIYVNVQQLPSGMYIEFAELYTELF